MFDEKSIEDWKFLLKNQVSPSKLEQFTDAIRLFTTNQACSDYNNMKLKELNQSIYKLIAINTPSAAKIYNSDNFNGLQNILNVCINAKITLTMNLWTNKGLVNGANGVIRDIIFAENAIEGSLPEAIFIEFDNYIGPKFFSADDHRHNWIPINPGDVYCKYHQASRQQYPIRLAYALTIHKSQGATLDKAVIDLGTSEQTLGLTFVALSRLKKFKDFLIEPFSLDRLKKNSKSASLETRQREERRIQELVEITKKNFLHLLK